MVDSSKMGHASMHVRECAMIIKRGVKLKVKSADLIHPNDADIVSLIISRVAGRVCEVCSITPAEKELYSDINGFCTAIHVSLDGGRRVWMPETWFEVPCMFNGVP